MRRGTQLLGVARRRGAVWSMVCLLVAANAGAEEWLESPLLPRPGLQPLEQAVLQPAPNMNPHVTPPPRSLAWALALSAAVPGAGEYYAGHTNRAIAFGTIEAGIWISYATFKVQEDLRHDSAIDYAVATAGALPEGALGERSLDPDDYYAAMAQFLRSDGPGQWNEFVRRRERDTGEVVGVEYTGDSGWAWPSVDHFVRYRDIRKSQLEAEDRATNMLAVAIVNRIASMVDVFQAMRSDHKHREEALDLGLRLGRTPREPLASLTLTHRF